MRGKDVVNLFGVKISTPLERDTVKQVLDNLPKLAIDKFASENTTIEQVMQAVNNEIKNFLTILDEVDAEFFCEIAEEYLPLSNECELNITQPEKDKWNFYIRFQIPRPPGIDCDSLVFLDKFIIESDSGLSLKEAKILRLKNIETAVYRDIAVISRKVEQALILAFSDLGIGIAYPDNLASAALLERLKRAVEKDFVEQHTVRHDGFYDVPLIHWSDKFGVQLFPEKSTAWDTKAVQEYDVVDVERLDHLFNQHYNRFKNVFIAGESFQKIKTATSILATSLFDDSLINKIILSMTAIEVLSERIRRPNAEIDALAYLSKKMNESEFDVNVKEAIKKGLDSLQYQSIGKNCRVLVKKLLGKKDSQLFHKLYDFRSQLVHAGAIKKDEKEEQIEMFNIYMESYSLAKRLLVAYVENSIEDET